MDLRLLFSLSALLSCSGKDPVELPAQPAPTEARLEHGFGALTVPPLADDDTLCASWTLNNEEPLYVQAVTLANEGLFHHSNWFVVPEDVFPGEDGYWPCEERGYHELIAGANGTVLAAQSTQSFLEEQRYGDGSVIKVPPRFKVVGGLHTLNAGNVEASSGLWMTLSLAHPSAVETVLMPIGMQYQDLSIPPNARSRFTTTCDWKGLYQQALGEDPWFDVHYVLPHYHYLGDHFELQVAGGDRDGEVLYSLDGFDGQANGRAIVPPVEVRGADGLRMSCGYDNPSDETVYWGNGEGEMCVALVLVDADVVFAGTVAFGSEQVGVSDGVSEFEAPCLAVFAPKSELFSLPTEEERSGPLYVPSSAESEGPQGPSCEDTPADAVAAAPATLDALSESIFTPSCTFSSCHGAALAGRLDLRPEGLYENLTEHAMAANTDLPLVASGDPDGSWLYQVLSRCTPEDKDGNTVAHMPANSPLLLDPSLVAMIRDWIVSLPQ